MKPFRIGQRVRVIKSRYGNEGKLATVASALIRGHDRDGSYDGHLVDIDGVGIRNKTGGKHVARTTWIEPVYDGDQKTSWSACEWIPVPMRKVKEAV